MNYQIRDMRENDWKFVREIYNQGIESNKATFTTKCPTYKEWDEAHHEKCRLIILSEERIIGFAVLAPTSKRPVFAGVTELSIYIDEAWQGKGVGKMLLKAMIEASEKNGFWTLQSCVFRDNISSRKLHASCGFREVGVRERLGRDRTGVWRDVILMERRAKSNSFHVMS